MGKYCVSPEHIGVLLETGAKPGLHVGIRMEPEEMFELHWAEPPPEEDVDVGLKHTPRLSANMPRALHAAMAASCAVTADTLAAFALRTDMEA